MQIIVLGATGRVGKQIVKQLLDRGHSVIQIVRSARNIPTRDNLKTVEASLLNLSPEEFLSYVKDCDVVMSALGHRMDLFGIPFFGLWQPPRDLCLHAAKMTCEAVENLDKPIKVIWLSTVGIITPENKNDYNTKTLQTLKDIIPPQKVLLNLISIIFVTQERV
ncbi:hypothetical protein HK098_005516 [Nowakowskiella sp. JEL0407]|nr:hypothetical protein HK098_005516 [Nowakowskiella sp. JEL0407]